MKIEKLKRNGRHKESRGVKDCRSQREAKIQSQRVKKRQKTLCRRGILQGKKKISSRKGNCQRIRSIGGKGERGSVMDYHPYRERKPHGGKKRGYWGRTIMTEGSERRRNDFAGEKGAFQ